MTVKELQKRHEEAQSLRVAMTPDGAYYVDSSSGQLAYKLTPNNGSFKCNCQDYLKNMNNGHFKCKHILALEDCLANGQTDKMDNLSRRIPKLDDRFLKTIENKEFVLYSGLLDLAHQKGLLRMETEIVQFPSPDNNQTAIVKAVAESKLGELFCDIGDANPLNTNSKVGRHLIRMASTRAKARALRDFTNIGITALEELGEGDFNGITDESFPKPYPAQTKKPLESVGSPNPPASPEIQTPPATTPRTRRKTKPTLTPDPTRPPVSVHVNVDSETPPKMSEAQKRAIHNIGHRRAISIEELGHMAVEAFGVSLDYLSAKDASDFIRQLQQAA